MGTIWEPCNKHIPLTKIDDICTLNNCLVTESRSQSEKCFSICVYRSPSQNNDEFKIFCVNYDLLLSIKNEEIPICSIITGDLHARSSNWWENDITNSVGQEPGSLTS